MLSFYGRENLWESKKVHVSIEGVGTIQGFGSANPSIIGSYDDREWDTYDGYVMAVIRSDIKAGDIKVTFSTDGFEEKTMMITSH